VTPEGVGRRPARILGVFAHPDDETFCAGGTFARYTDGGADAMVVSATRGQAGQIRDAEVATRRTLASVREQELRTACRVLGIERTLCLNYADGTLADVDPSQLEAEALKQIRAFEPDVVITFGDDGAYGHPDHIAISRATTDAFAQAREELRHGPSRLYHSHFPRSRLLLVDELSSWLVDLNARFKGSTAFARALSLFAEESTALGYASDFIDVVWFPSGVYIVEQGEPATSLYLILSGEADVVSEADDGTKQRLASLGPGDFFGELGVARRAVRAAHVIATVPVTCLVMSPAAPTAFTGRGDDARYVPSSSESVDGATGGTTAGAAYTTAIDVSDYVSRKFAAIAAHRSQFPLDPAMFPQSLLQGMLGTEYFVRVWPPRELETDILPMG
jgi:LmbE family N-acetylglucosaminyl deacetylase